jgi:hypothetical protein
MEGEKFEGSLGGLKLARFNGYRVKIPARISWNSGVKWKTLREVLQLPVESVEQK